MGRFMSRKFALAVGGILAALGSGLMAEVPWPDVVKAITAIVIGYGAAQGVVDAADKVKGAK